MVDVLTKLNRRAYVLPPCNPDAEHDVGLSLAPLHILAGWLDAPVASVTRYAQALQAAAPYSHVLVLISFGRDYVASQSTFLQSLKPAVDLIQKRKETRGASKALGHLHVFSNGGAYTSTMLARALKKASSAQEEGCSLPVQSICFDSAPGVSDFMAMVKAFMMPFRRRPRLFRAFLKLLCISGLAFLRLLKGVGLFQDPVAQLRRDILDITLFPASTRRHYIYSQSDDLIPYHRVIEHAERSKELFGAKRISSREFQGSGHVAHAKVHGPEYWKDVEQLLSDETPKAV